MLRPRRQPAEAQTAEQGAHGAHAKGHAEPRLDDPHQVDTTPPHHAVLGRIGALPNDLRHRLLLFRRQPGFGPATRLLVVVKTRQAHRVVAVHPIAQGLAIHTAQPCRIRPRCALANHRQGQHPSVDRRRRSTIGISAARRCLPKRLGRVIRPRQLNRLAHIAPAKSCCGRRITAAVVGGIPQSSKNRRAGISANLVGGAGLGFHGHSRIVDPRGEVIAESVGPGMAVASVDLVTDTARLRARSSLGQVFVRDREPRVYNV